MNGLNLIFFCYLILWALLLGHLHWSPLSLVCAVFLHLWLVVVYFGRRSKAGNFVYVALSVLLWIGVLIGLVSVLGILSILLGRKGGRGDLVFLIGAVVGPGTAILSWSIRKILWMQPREFTPPSDARGAARPGRVEGRKTNLFFFTVFRNGKS